MEISANGEDHPMQIRPTVRETEFFITSETGKGEYQLVCVGNMWKCTCKAFLKAKTPCKHVNKSHVFLKGTNGIISQPGPQGISPSSGLRLMCGYRIS
jgi:uncharacterized C2H2 Zn-finger protein